MFTLKLPQNIPYCYNRASSVQINRLEQTLQHFGVDSNHKLVGETILRLGEYLRDCPFVILPTDAPSKALFNMYKYYYRLTEDRIPA